MCQQSMKFVEIQEENRLQLFVFLSMNVFYMFVFLFYLEYFPTQFDFNWQNGFSACCFDIRNMHSCLLPQESQ